MTASEAARVILQGVREERWRILVGHDAEVLDRLVREAPEDAYEANPLHSAPKTVAAIHPEKVALPASHVLSVLLRVLLPFV